MVSIFSRAKLVRRVCMAISGLGSKFFVSSF